VAEDEWEDFLSATLLAFPPYGGSARQAGPDGDEAAQPMPPAALVEFLAVRLLLGRATK
jgi:hypothetical protein